MVGKDFPMNIVPKDKSWELLNNGFLYIYGRDHQFRPIMVCQPYILQNKLDYFSNSDVVNVCLFVCQYAVNNLLIPGQIENWIMFFNLKGTSLISLPEPIKLLVKELSDNFNFRLFKCYVLGMSWIMRLLYKFVSNFIGQPDEEKIVILEGRKDKRLFIDFTPENLEKRFGGNAEDLIYGQGDCLFPPRVPCDNVFFPWEDKNQILIREEEYIRRYNNGEIPIESISPFIEEKLRIERENKKIIIKENKNENLNMNGFSNTNNINTTKIVPNTTLINNNIITTNIYNYNYKNREEQRKKIAREIREFLKSDDWTINEEFTNKYNFKNMRQNSFINNLKSFIEKRERFKQGITKLKI